MATYKECLRPDLQNTDFVKVKHFRTRKLSAASLTLMLKVQYINALPFNTKNSVFFHFPIPTCVYCKQKELSSQSIFFKISKKCLDHPTPTLSRWKYSTFTLKKPYLGNSILFHPSSFNVFYFLLTTQVLTYQIPYNE